MTGSPFPPWLFLDHLDEVPDLPELTDELRALRMLCGAPDLAQPERPQRAAVPLALADRATNLPDLDLRHSRSPQVHSSQRPTPQRGNLPVPPGPPPLVQGAAPPHPGQAAPPPALRPASRRPGAPGSPSGRAPPRRPRAAAGA